MEQLIVKVKSKSKTNGGWKIKIDDKVFEETLHGYIGLTNFVKDTLDSETTN